MEKSRFTKSAFPAERSAEYIEESSQSAFFASSQTARELAFSKAVGKAPFISARAEIFFAPSSQTPASLQVL